MTINGREVEFKGTVGSMIDISDMCKDHDIRNAEELFKGGTADTLRNSIRFVCALSNGALSEGDLRNLAIYELENVLTEAMNAFKRDRTGEIRVVPKKEEATAGKE